MTTWNEEAQQCLDEALELTGAERGLIMVRGAVPGSKGGWIMLRDAVKSKLPEDVPMPGGFRRAGEEIAKPAEEAAEAAAEEAPAEAPAEETNGAEGADKEGA